MAGSVGWYRRDFTLPALGVRPLRPSPLSQLDHPLRVGQLQGHRVAQRTQARQPCRRLSPVRVPAEACARASTALSCESTTAAPGPTCPQGPGGGWWNFGGINQEVYLRSVQRADLSLVQVRPVLHCPTCAARSRSRPPSQPTSSPQTVAPRGTYGPRKLKFGSDTIAPHSTWLASAQVRLTAPHLWAPGTRTSTGHAHPVRRDGLARGYFTYSGVRTHHDHLDRAAALNGRILNLRGVNLHEQNLSTGAACDPRQLGRWSAGRRSSGQRSFAPTTRWTRRSSSSPTATGSCCGPRCRSTSVEPVPRPEGLAQRAYASCATTSSTTRTTLRSCCGASATSSPPRRARRGELHRRARWRSRTSSTPPARWEWRSLTGPGSHASRPTRRST